MSIDSSRTPRRPLLLSATNILKRKTEEVGSRETVYTAKTLAQCSTAEARLLVPYEHARRLGVLPLGVISVLGDKTLSVAVAPVHSPELISQLRFTTGHQVKFVPSPSDALQQAIHMAYLGSESRLQEKISALQQVDKLIGVKPDPKPDFRVAQGDVAQLLSALVDYAIAREASDIDLLPLRDGGYVRMRVHGELFSHERSYCSLENHAKLMSRLKVLAALDTTQRATPQDGSFTIPVQERHVYARLSIMPTVHGEKAVIRLMNPASTLKLSELGLSPRAEELLEKHGSRSEGALLFAGPTGSGKSTTMYALLRELASRNLSVSTIEDPVETQVEGISQTSIDERRGLGYAMCLKSILRQDPDVILLGEMRDEESARIALQAAVTGHVLLSTLHARTTLEVFTRLRSLNADMLSVAQAVSLIVCQRLVPTLCNRCKVIDLESTKRWGRGDLFRAVGCTHCDYSGFSGASLAVECLEMHSDLYEAIVHSDLKRLKLSDLSLSHYLPLQGGLEKLLEEGSILYSDYLSLL